MAYLTGAARQGVARTAAYYREQRALLLSHCCDGVMHFHCVDTSSGRDAQTLLHEIDGTREMCRGSCNVDPITCLAARGATTDAPAGKGGGSAGIGSSTAALGERCAQGFCEDQGNCPQCEHGLFCRVPKGMACAGTCYGTCAKAPAQNPFGH